MEEKALELTRAARLRLITEAPYLASVVWSMPIIPAEPGSMPGPMGVDKEGRLYLDPAKVQGMKVGEAAAVLWHEAWHVLRRHAERLDPMVPADQHRLANLAGDAEINDNPLPEGLAYPGHPVYPSSLGLPEGRLAEWYLEKLLERLQGQKQGQRQGKGGGGGQQQGGSDGQQQGDGGGQQQGQEGGGGGQQQGGSGGSLPQGWDCGSGAGGPRRSWELPSDQGPRGMDPMHRRLVERQVAKELLEHAKSRGTLPAGLERWARGLLKPTLPWPKVLARLVRQGLTWASGAVDYTWQRPSRRASVTRPLVLPALRRPQVEVAVVLDTSGSMSDQDLGIALAELQGVLQAAGQAVGVQVISCDAAAGQAKRVFSPRQVEIVGGGGTDMRVGIEAALKLRPRPQLVVVLTDGYTPWPAQAPRDCRVVVVLVGRNVNEDVPAWATTLRARARSGER